MLSMNRLQRSKSLPHLKIGETVNSTGYNEGDIGFQTLPNSADNPIKSLATSRVDKNTLHKKYLIHWNHALSQSINQSIS